MKAKKRKNSIIIPFGEFSLEEKKMMILLPAWLDELYNSLIGIRKDCHVMRTHFVLPSRIIFFFLLSSRSSPLSKLYTYLYRYRIANRS